MTSKQFRKFLVKQIEASKIADTDIVDVQDLKGFWDEVIYVGVEGDQPEDGVFLVFVQKIEPTPEKGA